MIPDSSNIDPDAGSELEQAWTDAWHRWRVIIPRRSIAGRLVRGTIWRRNHGGHWIYKKFVEHSEDGDPKIVPNSGTPCRLLPDIIRRAGRRNYRSLAIVPRHGDGNHRSQFPRLDRVQDV